MEAPEAEGNMVTLGKNFAIGLTKEAPAAETRGQLVGVGNSIQFHWLPELDDTNTPLAADQIGLAWVGPVANDKVYTNYLFEHFAWPNGDPSVDPCDGTWENLVFMNEADFNAMEKGGTKEPTSDWVKTWSKADDKKVAFTTNGNVASSEVNTQAGYFKTENLTIFGGDYIVYAPYDETLVDVGNLKAKSKTSFTDVNIYTAANWTEGLQGIADDVFSVGKIKGLKGGDMVSGFNLTPISGYIKVKLNVNGTKIENIKNIAIFSEDGIVYEQNIDASKVMAEDYADCLMDDEEIKKTQLINAEVAGENGFTLDGTAETNYYINLPALPQTIKNPSIVLIDKNGANIRLEGYVNNSSTKMTDLVVESNKECIVEVYLNGNTGLTSDQFYVVDMPTFQLAMTKAGIDGEDGKAGKTTVTLLTDIVYDGDYTNNRLIVVNRDMDIVGGTITVPADETLRLELHNGATLYMEEDFIINGKSLCTDCTAEVTIYSRKEPATLNFGGNVTVPEAATLKVTSYKYSETASSYTKVNIPDGKLENSGTVEIYGNSTMEVKEFVNNNVVKMTAAENAADNNVTVETLTNATEATWLVDAYTVLTVNTLTNDGDLTIKATGAATEGEDGTVNVETVADNNGDIYNFGVYNSNGTTNLNAGSTFTDYVGSQYGNKMPILAKGENGAKYICEVNTSAKTEGDRLGYALGSKMVTTDVRFVEGEEDLPHVYQLNDYDELRLDEVNFEIDVKGKDFVFKNNKDDGQIVLGGDLTVTSAKSVLFNGNDTKVGGDMTVNWNAEISNNGKTSAVVTVGGDLTLNKKSALTVNALANAAAATELTKESWTVVGNVAVDGESSLEVVEKAAAEIGGDLTVVNGTAKFGYSSYTDVAGSVNIGADGTFNRVLSSETGGNANPAQVWCAKYTNLGTEVNGAAQVVSAAN